MNNEVDIWIDDVVLCCVSGDGVFGRFGGAGKSGYHIYGGVWEDEGDEVAASGEAGLNCALASVVIC